MSNIVCPENLLKRLRDKDRFSQSCFKSCTQLYQYPNASQMFQDDDDLTFQSSVNSHDEPSWPGFSAASSCSSDVSILALMCVQ